jgi:hypothetical protein
MNEFTCKIYIQHDGSFYLFKGDFDTVREALTKGILAFPADQKIDRKDFPVGSKVYFEELDENQNRIEWTEVVECISFIDPGCAQCAFVFNKTIATVHSFCRQPNSCAKKARGDGKYVIFKKIGSFSAPVSPVPTPFFDEQAFAKELSDLLNKHGLTECVFAGTPPDKSRMFGLFGAESKDGQVTEKQMIAAGFNAARIYQSAREKIIGTLDKIGEKI